MTVIRYWNWRTSCLENSLVIGVKSRKRSLSNFGNRAQLVTKVRKNMKNKLLPLFDKILLRKCSIIESVNDPLKNISQIEHFRHRSPLNSLLI